METNVQNSGDPNTKHIKFKHSEILNLFFGMQNLNGEKLYDLSCIQIPF